MDDEKRKPGRPNQGRRTATAIRLKPELHERLTVAASERDVSINFLVNRAVGEFLDRLIPVDEMIWTRPYPQRDEAQTGRQGDA